jgi:hypothetical protein
VADMIVRVLFQNEGKPEQELLKFESWMEQSVQLSRITNAVFEIMNGKDIYIEPGQTVKFEVKP